MAWSDRTVGASWREFAEEHGVDLVEVPNACCSVCPFTTRQTHQPDVQLSDSWPSKLNMGEYDARICKS
ncbi:hypothetical protein M407DRAFT_24428 [Tulasnella calospora MUT 4182]|uniref:Uncharacterized protein n=1 Tax=Tulasnella calospora MUT 4182 TaxID=1051891 RepID=A0A0C3QJJ0_9AGAM|nr:hypothetical protein M407DRAFT_24428 [Tulasnella calospora MUT 4182]